MRVAVRGSILVVSGLLSVFAWSQGEGGLARKPKAPVQSAPGPLSIGELYASVEKVELAVRKVLLQSSEAPTPRRFTADRPAKRGEVVTEFARLFGIAKPYFKFTPRAVKFDAKVISFPAADPNRKHVETLIRFGFVGRVAPVATAAGPNLTLEEYGDALGFFIARLGDLTHTPSAKWSPYLFNHKDG